MHITRRNRPKLRFSRGNPQFLGESPCNDITFSKIHHNLARKVRKRDVREISYEEGVMAALIFPHFKTLKLYYDKMGPFRVLKLIGCRDINVI